MKFVLPPVVVAAIFVASAPQVAASTLGLMFESIVDGAAGSELAFVTAPTFADLIGATNTTSQFSQINVASSFDTTGITWDGSQFILMFESIVDGAAGSELAFVTAPTFADLIGATNTTSQFSQINVASSFDTTGITWDGSQFILMFESIVDGAAGSELAFVTAPTFADLIGATNLTSQFSQINVASSFNTTGIWTEPMAGGGGSTVIPLPASGWLLGGVILMAGIAARRRRIF